ncbi:hypothetical protein B296_00048649, partial [Ensete ventricosum]
IPYAPDTLDELLTSVLEAQLQVGFYKNTCPQAESIIASEVRRALASNIGLAAGLVRMHFHDCFVRVSKFNLLLMYQVPAGRRDGRVSLVSEVLANLPGPTFDVDQLTQSFASKGLTQDEMVTLSGTPFDKMTNHVDGPCFDLEKSDAVGHAGAHTIGRSHCAAFSSRLVDFNSTDGQDPSLDAAYASQLKQQCPQGSNDTSLVVFMDPRSPYTLDTAYYANILQNRGLFASDQALATDGTTEDLVKQNAAAGGGIAWKRKFAAAMVRMGQIDVLTGSNGEIRSRCRFIN